MDEYLVRVRGATIENVGRALTEEDYNVLREDIRNEFDYYTEENTKRALKRAGVVAGIGISIIAVITELLLCKRRGKDIISDARKDGKKTMDTNC